MNPCFKLSIGAVIAALAAVTVRRQNAEIALLLGLVGSCLIALAALELLSPVLDYVRKLCLRAGLEQKLLSPLLKSVGAALLTQTASALCQDAGQSALARTVELGGTALCLVLALPLLETVLSLIEQLSGY